MTWSKSKRKSTNRNGLAFWRTSNPPHAEACYGDDLAYIHDVGFGFHANGLAPALLNMLDQAGMAGGLVVDLGCGSGIWAAHLLGAARKPC